ncbi:MAG: HD domain-containing protein [Pseudomonadota bacterium]|nr:HD domain-containing protein [Pseudomonadota bacterium]
MSEPDSTHPGAFDPNASDARDQEALGKAIEQARGGEDRALAQQVRDGGEQTVRLLTGLLRLMRTHNPDNHAFDNPTRDLAAVLARLVDLLGPLHLVCVEGQLYLNDVRVRMEDRIGGAADLAEELQRHGAGGLRIGTPLDESAIRRLVHTLSRRPSPERPLPALRDAIRDAGLPTVLIQGLYRLRVTGEAQVPVLRGEREVQETMERATGLVTEAWDNLAEARVPNPLPVRRLVNDIIDSTGHVDLLLDATPTAASAHAAAHANHSLRVCTLAVLIGKELGLTQASLADLGVAAMFHDTGYASREDGFAPPFSRHGSAGARLLLKQRGFHQAKVKRLLVAYEHHRALDARPSLYARIVRVADDFDTLTRHRPGGALYGPSDALARMCGASGELYDPAILQAFINRIGRYPPGTLLRLEDGRWVVAVSGARSPETFAKPACRVVRDAEGNAVTDGDLVDLAVEGVVENVIELGS